MEDGRRDKMSIQAGHQLSKVLCPSRVQEREEVEPVPYENLTARVLYLADWTRTHLSHAVRALSRYMSSPCQQRWAEEKGLSVLKKNGDKKFSKVSS